jgi:hypothetical protein
MKTLKIVLGVLTVVFIVVLTATTPKREQRIPTYNAATEIRTQGVVQEVQEFYCPISDDQGIHLKLKTDSGILQVHVAPARFLRSQLIRFNNGDKVEVLGSRLGYNGVDSLLAREITRGEEVFILRDHLGQPVWR